MPHFGTPLSQLKFIKSTFVNGDLSKRGGGGPATGAGEVSAARGLSTGLAGGL